MTHETALDVLEAGDISEVLRLRVSMPEMNIGFFGRTDSGLRGIPMWPGWKVKVPSEVEKGLVEIESEHGIIVAKVIEVIAWSPQTAQMNVKIVRADFIVSVSGHHGYVIACGIPLNPMQLEFLNDDGEEYRVWFSDGSGSP